MKLIRASNLTQLHSGLVEKLAVNREWDLKTGSDYQIHSLLGVSESMIYNLDLRDYWIPSTRWTRLCKDYLDPDLLIDFWSRAPKVKNRIAWLPTGLRVKAHENRGKGAWRHHGACILGITFQLKPLPKLVLISRTSYIGYLSVLDLAVAHQVAQGIGIPLEEITFEWHLMVAQVSWMKALGGLIHHFPDLLEGREQTTPILKRASQTVKKLRQYDTDNKHYGDMLYNPERRLRRRLHTEIDGYDQAVKWEGSRKTLRTEETYYYKAFKLLPHCPVTSLNLMAIGLSSEEEED